MSVPTKAHAKTRPPSGAKRWGNCPNSAFIGAMYPNEETEASKKGDVWHEYMEDTIRFGVVPRTASPDIDEAMSALLAYVKKRIADKGEVPIILVETQLDIPMTGEFGTCDIALIWSDEIEVLDLKSGYVPVDVNMNDQMFNYLDGIVAKYGPRDKYLLSVHQPNYDHIDGFLRHCPVTEADRAKYAAKVAWSIANEHLVIAGPHCKETYCPHRAACATFADYTRDDLTLGWNTSEYKALSDDKLAKALDDAEELQGYRNALRTEAMRRIIGLDRDIRGYKVVKGRRSRAVIKPLELINNVCGILGFEWAAKLFPDLGWAGDALYGMLSGNTGPITDNVLKSLGTPKHIEDVMKMYAKEHNLPHGGWKGIYDNVVSEYIRETANGLALEKAIDGRPAHKRGSEFGTLAPPNTASQEAHGPVTLI